MPLTEKDLPNLMDDLIQVASKWMDLGIKLEMKRSTLLIVEKDHPNDQVRCLSDMLHRLIRKRKVEWRNITEALRSDTLDEGVLATDLEEKYHSGANPLQQDKLKTEETSDQELGMLILLCKVCENVLILIAAFQSLNFLNLCCIDLCNRFCTFSG